MKDIDIAGTLHSMRAGPPPGVRVKASGQEITISVIQECQVALPSANLVPEVSVSTTSNRPGVAGQVTIGANLKSPDGNYQGPTSPRRRRRSHVGGRGAAQRCADLCTTRVRSRV